MRPSLFLEISSLGLLSPWSNLRQNLKEEEIRDMGKELSDIEEELFGEDWVASDFQDIPSFLYSPSLNLEDVAHYIRARQKCREMSIEANYYSYICQKIQAVLDPISVAPFKNSAGS